MSLSGLVLILLLAANISTALPTGIDGYQPTYELCFCGEHYVGEDLREPTPPLNIREMPFDVDAEFLNTFETVHEFTYLKHVLSRVNVQFRAKTPQGL